MASCTYCPSNTLTEFVSHMDSLFYILLYGQIVQLLLLGNQFLTTTICLLKLYVYRMVSNQLYLLCENVLYISLQTQIFRVSNN